MPTEKPTNASPGGLPFGPDSDNRVPGQLIIKLTRQGEVSVTASIPPAPAKRAAGELPSAFGSAALDTVLSSLGLKSIVKLHAPFPSVGAPGVQTGESHPPGLLRGVTGAPATGLTEQMSGTYRVQLDEKANLDKAVKRLQGVAEVAAVEPNRFRCAFAVPNDPMYALEWGLTKINCPAAWDRTKGSASVIVAVVDSGVDLDHPDLAANLQLPGRDLVDLAGVTAPTGWHFEGDFLTVDDDPQDEVGHGTHVAGTIAAVSNNATGVAGVTWNCKILPVRVLARTVRNSDGAVSGMGTSSDIAAGIRWAADHGAAIINMSLGGYTDTFVERDAVAYAVSKGVVVVAAMGNDNTASPSYPAAYPSVIAVGAIDSAEKRAWFSNFGPHISLAAPGVGIRSTVWDNSYTDMDGTSMASPHVAGVSALVKSCKPSLTAAEIADILKTTAKPLKDNPADPVPNNNYGYGLVDAKAAVEKACPIYKLKLIDDGGGIKKVLDDPKIKFKDDPKLKFKDDKVKFADEKLKYADDYKPYVPGWQPGPLTPAAAGAAAYQQAAGAKTPITDPALKPQIDQTPKLKFRDDKVKFFDDKNKVQDDKLKFHDDKAKFSDDKGKAQDDKLKVHDDKLKFTDEKLKYADDVTYQPGPQVPGPGSVSGAAPFILATPHHSMAWAQTYPGAYQATIAQLEAQLAQCQEALSQMDQAYQQGQLGEAEQQQMMALYQEYQYLLAEYQRLCQTGQ